MKSNAIQVKDKLIEIHNVTYINLSSLMPIAYSNLFKVGCTHRLITIEAFYELIHHLAIEDVVELPAIVKAFKTLDSNVLIDLEY